MLAYRRLRVELLEDRQLLVADLAISDAFLVNSRNAPISNPVHGEQTFVRATWTTTDLSTSDNYIVRFWLDGVGLDSSSIQGQPGELLAFNWYHGGWYAEPGSHTITVQVDGTNAIDEPDESNNTLSFEFSTSAPTTLPQRLLRPVVGTDNKDFVIVNFADIDPTSEISDFRNRNATYNGHDALDISVANFALMDSGVPIRAAADGTVIAVADGNFDREVVWQTPPPRANYVILDHGNGWQTWYWHLKRDTVAVTLGQSVTAGEQIGEMGSSGFSSGPHLHFTVVRNDSVVETSFAANDYWENPYAYTYDSETELLDFGVTNEAPSFAELIEKVSDIDGYGSGAGQRVYAWGIYSALETGDTMDVRVYRPDGSLYFSSPFVQNADYRWSWWYWWTTLPSSPTPGEWTAEWIVEGRKIGEQPFEVGSPRPEIRVYQEETFIIDGRSTPLEFESVEQGDMESEMTFLVENHGYASLDVSSVELPPGYVLAEPLDASILPQQSDSFTIRLDSALPGTMRGAVQINTNDISEPAFAFAIEGTVTGFAAGDFDKDGDVDGDDFLAWQTGFGLTSGATQTDGDADGDGDVDGDDFLDWQSNFGFDISNGPKDDPRSNPVAAAGESPLRRGLFQAGLRNEAADVIVDGRLGLDLRESGPQATQDAAIRTWPRFRTPRG